MPFNIIRADITTLNTDAIVNAANNRLQEGGGVCGAIFSAASACELQKACDAIGYCPTGQAVITPGFNLSAKYVIHTVGPVYGVDINSESLLYSCYKNSLTLAKENELSSIAFPVISSGIFGHPKQEALSIAQRAIKDFLSDNDMDVTLVVYDKATFTISEELFNSIQTYISENMVAYDARMRKEAVYNVMYDAAMPQSGIEELFEDEHETFSQMLFRLIDEKGYSDVEVYKRANIDRKLFSKMRKKDYVPKKSTVMALVIALRLNMRQAKALLCEAGFAFSHSSKSDIIIQYFIENKNYDIFELNETLFAFDQPLLGA
ncbi:MAG: macro domain-containing protein [Clostridia bacterium]|nr:macro domain-containing protein [Clostridia bacterium]